ncbi:MAG: portal protein [Pseudomonadota bacterium]
MADQRALDLLRRHEQMKDRRTNWETLWREVAERFLTRSDDFRTQHAPGENRAEHVFDSFPTRALDRFASVLDSGLTPRNRRWFRLSTGDDDLDEQADVKHWLDLFGQKIWRKLYSARSNLASHLHETYLSLGGFGTGCMHVEMNRMGDLVVRSPHLSQMHIAASQAGQIDVFHREFMLEARQAIQKFGRDAPAKCFDMVRQGKPFTPFHFLHCVAPREDYDETRIGNNATPLVEYYVSCDEKKIVREGGYDESPYMVSRYVLSPNEIYGRSPAIIHLADAKMLNRMMWTVLETAELAADPPALYPNDDLVGQYGIAPGERIMGGIDDQGRQLVQPFRSGAQPQIGLDMIARVRDQIDDGMLGLYFRVLVENPNMTATQALLIAQQQGQMTSPAISRQQSELLDPLIRAVADGMAKRGEVPPMPESVRAYIEEVGEPIIVRYESPMVHAAESDRGVAILRLLEAGAPLMEMDPSVRRAVKPLEMYQELAKSLGVPPRVLASEEEMAAALEQDEQQMAVAGALEAAPVAAQAAKTIAETQAIASNLPGAQPPAVPLVG